MSEDNRPAINITSHNQSGGITAHTVVIGKPQFELTDEYIREVVAHVKGQPVLLTVIGSNPRTQEMGNRLAAALERAGSRLQVLFAGMYQPMPDGPITVTPKDGFVEVFLAPNA
jgi:hypothetical protein